jgi:hypothetical protein
LSSPKKVSSTTKKLQGKKLHELLNMVDQPKIAASVVRKDALPNPGSQSIENPIFRIMGESI